MQVAQVLHDLTHRSGDMAARYGGEEFVLLLASSAEPTAAANMAEVSAASRAGAAHPPCPVALGLRDHLPGGAASVVAGPHLSADAVPKLAPTMPCTQPRPPGAIRFAPHPTQRHSRTAAPLKASLHALGNAH